MKLLSIVTAVTAGLCTLYGGHADAQEQEQAVVSFVKKSDVLFTQPRWDEMEAENHGKYSDYRVNTTMWGFLPPTYPGFDVDIGFDYNMEGYVNGILNHEAAGVDWVSRIEWDVIWEGMVSKYPATYPQAMVKRLDGSAMEIDWFPGHYFFSTHEPIFREYVKWQIQDIAFFGDDTGPDTVDAILFDSQQSSPAHYYWGGDFSDGAMANFNSWLSDNFSTAELAAMGISDINTFHYGDFLIAAGYTVTQYETETQTVPNSIPLSDVYRHFLQDWNNTYLADLVQFTDNIAQAKGYPYQPGVGYISVGTSSPILDPYWNGIRMAPTDEFDFYVQEFNHRANNQTPSADAMLMYKLGEALDKPLALTGQPYPDWDYMIDNPTAVDLPRSWIAQAYANGAVFMAPEHMWAYNNSGAQRYYDPAVGDYDYIYSWIETNSYLFDGYGSVAKVGLVYSHTAYRTHDYDQLDVFAAAAGLMEQNIPYKLLIAGDDWWPKKLTDASQTAAMNGYSVIVTTDYNGVPLDTAQQAVLDSAGDKVVAWPDTAAIFAKLPKEIEVNVANVATFPRVNNNHSHPNAPKIVHLVNRDYNAATKSINGKTNINLTINDTLFGSEIVGARYNQPGEASVEIAVNNGQGSSTVILPTLANWGIVELFTAMPIPPKEDFAIAEKETRTEGFDTNFDADAQSYVFLDGQGSNNEGIQRFDQGWAWGAYSAGSEISQNTQWAGLVQFQQGAKAGSRIYTRFDTDTVLSATSTANDPSTRVDLSANDAALVLNLAQSPAQQWAMLVRDDQGWWQSSAIDIPQQSWDSLRSDKYNIGEFSWTALDNSNAGVIDMDEVDAGGEAAVALGSVSGAVPNLAQVDGFGLIALEDATGVMSINDIGLANAYFNSPDAPAIIDSDLDGVPDEDDAFPNDPSESVDTDGDGIGNNADSDDDNDGVLDGADAFPLNPSESVDTDGDGIGNNTDVDDDNDTVLDSQDAFPLDPTESLDTDGDLIGNNADTDDDNDGFSDVYEINAGTDPLDANSVPGIDSDLDGVPDDSDAFPNDPNEWLDTDGDLIGNNADVDDDNDGVTDSADAFPLDATESVDTDGDLIGNNADTDDDNDGVADGQDVFPLDATEWLDTDGDLIGNNADTDDDNDGYSDAEEINAGSDPLDAGSIPPPPPVLDLVRVVELFDASIIPGQMYNLDNSGSGDEYIGRFSKGWAWGGYTSGSVITHNTQWGGIVQFQNGAKAGSRIYTRFDTTSAMNTGGNSNVAAISVNMSDASAKLVINVAESPAQNFAMLVRTPTGWWQSSAIAFPAQGFSTTRSNTNIAINGLLWQALSSTDAGVMDMDNVNQGGESITGAPTGTPSAIDLSAVTGFGIIALDSRNTVFSVNKLGLANVAVTDL